MLDLSAVGIFFGFYNSFKTNDLEPYQLYYERLCITYAIACITSGILIFGNFRILMTASVRKS